MELICTAILGVHTIRRGESVVRILPDQVQPLELESLEGM